MSEPRSDVLSQVLAALAAAMPGVEVSPLGGEEELRAQLQRAPGVYVALESIVWDPPRVHSDRRVQNESWTWHVWVVGGRYGDQVTTTAYELADRVRVTLGGWSPSGYPGGSFELVREWLADLVYGLEVRVVELRWWRQWA
jgi:hypothetical protein